MPSPRLYGLICARNEASRYLRRCLDWQLGFLHDVFVYDDQSTDDTVAIAERLGAIVDVRPDGVTSFEEHEGEFRQAAWEAFEVRMRPLPGDWILAFDADEFLVGPRSTDLGWLLQHTADSLQRNGFIGAKVKIHEVFGFQDDTPLVRTDGCWGQITGLRFFEYRIGGRFANRKLGCGSAPFYVSPHDSVECLELLHFGYAEPQDRTTKHNRYYGTPEHSGSHVASILTTPEVVKWNGQVPR